MNTKNLPALREPAKEEKDQNILLRPRYIYSSTAALPQAMVMNWDEPKVNRRYSFDDNGGGYAGL